MRITLRGERVNKVLLAKRLYRKFMWLNFYGHYLHCIIISPFLGTGKEEDDFKQTSNGTCKFLPLFRWFIFDLNLKENNTPLFLLQKERLNQLRRETAREEFENMNMVSRANTSSIARLWNSVRTIVITKCSHQ